MYITEISSTILLSNFLFLAKPMMCRHHKWMTSLEKRQLCGPPFEFFILLIVFNVLLVLLWNGRELQIIMKGFSHYNRRNWFFKWSEFIITSTAVRCHTWKNSIMKLQLVPGLVLYNSWQRLRIFIFQNFFSRFYNFLIDIWLSHDQFWAIIKETASLTWLQSLGLSDQP